MRKKPLVILSVLVIILVAGLSGGYSAWNSAAPDRTCSRCHEINPSFTNWQISSHREISCDECHGTALSNGFHSLEEKGNMVLTHLNGKKYNEDIRLTEDQMIRTMENCAKCHREEYGKWLSGGHSAQYGHIFLNAAHNQMETPYWDCFRCHGMMYEGTIHDLLQPVSGKDSWRLKDPGHAEIPAIPCLACHQIHTAGSIHQASGFYHLPSEMFYLRKSLKDNKNPAAGLYIRSDKMFLRADMLPEPVMYYKGKKLRISGDPLQRLCTQCHAPDAAHTAGSQDDRTPAGVHEGLSCTACHATHSNDATASCANCHPSISNCKLDVTTMNTSYFNRESEHNIHFVGCEDCHGKRPVNRRGGS